LDQELEEKYGISSSFWFFIYFNYQFNFF
jgi:hypothetical protein